MGVPVITLTGDTHASRVGMSLLSNIGLLDLIAKTPDEYTDLAANLAHDLNRLQHLRENLREMVSQSHVCNISQFILQIENSYRKIWKEWCEKV
jgi:predicted O-linked N-acetylglucosamine transferase (SPINDLY family)